MREPLVLLVIGAIALVVSGINPYDRTTWILEVFIEWWALLGGASADAFRTQGDPWDTQWDMFLAFVGSATAQVTLGRVHDRQLASYTDTSNPS